MERYAGVITSAPAGEPPRVVAPRIPVASVTGTNGKTTTTRLLAHICMTAGLRTGWSSTDGVVVQGELVEPGDYSGPAGARAVLDAPGVEIGILETARGGMLLRGMGVSHNDVSVVTNVSADHLGLQGIDTVDQLAEVKAIVTRVTRPGGVVVLNGDDPRVWAMRTGLRAHAWVFSADEASPSVREALGAGGRAVTVMDGDISVLSGNDAPDRLVHVVDVPMTLSGLSRHNVLNALAGVAAAPRPGHRPGAGRRGAADLPPGRLPQPGPDEHLHPAPGGRCRHRRRRPGAQRGRSGSPSGRVPRAHRPGSRVHLVLGTAGDRTDEILQSLGEIAGLRADHVVLAHKERYLRGRTTEDLERQLRVGLARAGVADTGSHPTELAGLRACLGAAADGDVVAVMCHAERTEIAGWLGDHDAVPDDAASIRRKVVRARGEHDLEDEIEALWAMDDPAGADRDRSPPVCRATGRCPDRLRVRRHARQRRQRGARP